MRDYGKIHTSFWSSLDIRSLSEDGRTLALYLLTSPHSTISGVFRLPDGYVCEDLKWDSERVNKGFTELLSKGFANRCETTKWVYIFKHFVWNKPENPNQRKAAKRIALMIPDECSWKQEFMRRWAEFLGITKEEYFNRSETVNEQLPQEQEQEQEQDIYNSNELLAGQTTNPDNETGKPQCPHQQIIELYHQELPTSPKIKSWTKSRAALLRTRWNEESERQNLDYWKRFFHYVSQSDFLTGKSHAADRKPFCVPLEWLLKAENFAKVLEGRYHEKRAVASALEYDV